MRAATPDSVHVDATKAKVSSSVPAMLRDIRGTGTYDAHVRDGFLVLRGGRASSSSVTELWVGEVGELNGVEQRRLRVHLICRATIGACIIMVVVDAVEACKHLDRGVSQPVMTVD